MGKGPGYAGSIFIALKALFFAIGSRHRVKNTHGHMVEGNNFARQTNKNHQIPITYCFKRCFCVRATVNCFLSRCARRKQVADGITSRSLRCLCCKVSFLIFAVPKDDLGNVYRISFLADFRLLRDWQKYWRKSGFHVCFWLGLNMLESLPNTVNRQGNSKRMLKITYARQHDLGRVSCDIIRMWLWCYMHMYSIDSTLCMLHCCRAYRAPGPSSHWYSRPPIRI